MSELIDSARDIPAAPYYVLAKDTFMSGWGGSQGRPNIVILPCESYEEAEIVLDNAQARSEMKYCRINSTKPRLQRWNTYSLFNREEAERWYTRGGFLPHDRS